MSEPKVNQNTLRMGTKPMLPLIIEMSLPSMFSMLIQALYNIVDSIFVSRLGEYALSAVSLVYPIQLINISVGVGTSVGLSSLISRRLGAKDYEAAQSAAEHGLFLALCHWLLFVAFGLFGSRSFASAFSENATLIEPAVQYCTIVCVGSLFALCSSSMEKIMQAGGNMIAPMWCMLSGAVTNIILDPIMIFGLFGFPAMGVAGAAVATVIGQCVCFLVANIFMHKLDLPVKVKYGRFAMSGRTIKDIYQVGLPSMVMQSIGSVMTIALNAILIGFSEAAVAVLGVYFKLQSFVFMPVFGMNHGLMPIMGYNYGAKNRKRLMNAYKLGIVIAMCIMVVGLLLFQLIPDKLMSLFKAEGDLLTVGVKALRTISLCFPFAAIGIITGTLFQATGRGIYSLFTSLLRQLIVIVPAAYVLSKMIGVMGVWYAFPLAEGFSLCFSLLMLRRLWRTDISHIPLKQAM
ncbi:MAG: MATE family efflux transporter [Clostridia bacterium]|nr:MATE family efflux transporter [Clostridia bacterium]